MKEHGDKANFPPLLHKFMKKYAGNLTRGFQVRSSPSISLLPFPLNTYVHTYTYIYTFLTFLVVFVLVSLGISLRLQFTRLLYRVTLFFFLSSFFQIIFFIRLLVKCCFTRIHTLFVRGFPKYNVL